MFFLPPPFFSHFWLLKTSKISSFFNFLNLILTSKKRVPSSSIYSNTFLDTNKSRDKWEIGEYSNIKHSKVLLDSILKPFGQKQTKQRYLHNHYITWSNFLFSRLPHTEREGEKNTKQISIGTSNKDSLEQKGEKNTKKISIGTSNKDDLEQKGEKNTKKISIRTSNKDDLEQKGEKNTKKISIETSNKDDLEQKGEKNTKKLSIETSSKNDLEQRGEKNTKKISIGTSNKNDLCDLMSAQKLWKSHKASSSKIEIKD